MKLHVTVTAAHIQRGERGEWARCPIALAIHDTGYPFAIVRPCTVAPSGMYDIPAHRVALPTVAQKFIRDFDNGSCKCNLDPFEFDIENWPDGA